MDVFVIEELPEIAKFTLGTYKCHLSPDDFLSRNSSIVILVKILFFKTKFFRIPRRTKF